MFLDETTCTINSGRSSIISWRVVPNTYMLPTQSSPHIICCMPCEPPFLVWPHRSLYTPGEFSRYYSPLKLWREETNRTGDRFLKENKIRGLANKHDAAQSRLTARRSRTHGGRILSAALAQHPPFLCGLLRKSQRRRGLRVYIRVFPT